MDLINRIESGLYPQLPDWHTQNHTRIHPTTSFTFLSASTGLLHNTMNLKRFTQGEGRGEGESALSYQAANLQLLTAF